jgi:outer membrane protein assembly factor BamB
MTWRRFFLSVAIISLILSSAALGTEVEYALEDVGGGQWVYHYTVRNTTLGEPIEQFIIWFEPGLYESLSIVSEPEIGYDWYQDTVEPDPVWLYYGAYRALAWDEGIGVGEYESGFAVRFTYLGVGAPGVQEFDIVDPNEYFSLEAGWTAPVYWVDAEAEGNPEQIGTPDKPFATIQESIDAALDGYTINVLGGLYEETIDFSSEDMMVKSYGATMDNPAVIAGTGTVAVAFANGNTTETVLDGFLITSSSGWRGIVCNNNSSPTIRNNLIFGCGYNGPSTGTALRVGVGCHPVIAFNTITYNYGIESFYIDNSTGFSGLISHCIIYGNEDYDLVVTHDYMMETGSIEYCNIGKVNYDWLGGTEVDEYGNFSKSPRFVRQASDGGDGWFDKPDTEDVDESANNIQGDWHLRNESPCINAGDPNYVAWEGQMDWDGQGRVILDRVDIGIDEVAPSIAVTKPAGGEVWVAGSTHEIRWESFAVDDVDIYYSSNNGTDWDTVEASVTNTGSYEWQLPAVDSGGCLVWVAASVEPNYVEYTTSGVFTIHPSDAGPDVESAWPTLGSNFQRTGLSGRPGDEVGCVKWQFATDGEIYTSVAIGAEDRVHVACEDGKVYTIDPNGGAQVWVFDVNSPMTSSPTVGADGTVYVGCMNGKLYAIDKDGNLRWTHDTGGFIYSSPAVDPNGRVFFGSQDGKLYALGSDGSELWEYATAGPGQVGGAILASPVIGLNGSVYIAGVYDPNLYALDPNDGSIRWARSFESLIGDPCAEGDLKSGLPLASPVVGPDGTLYMLMGEDDINLYAIDDANEGGILWSIDPIDYMEHIMDEHLMGWWEFDGDATDSSGNGRDGIAEPGVSFVTDPERGGVVQLDGSDDHVYVPGDTGITGTTPRTISAWVKTGYDGVVISWGAEDGAGKKWDVKVHDHYYPLGVWVGGASARMGSEGLPYLCDNQWHHIAIVWEDDGTPDVRDVKFYADGAEFNTYSTSGPLEIDTGSWAGFTIGYTYFLGPGPIGYAGKIDDVRVWDRALSYKEIYGRGLEVYCWQRPAIGPDGTIYISFDDTYLWAFDTAGNVKWATKLGTAGGFTFTVGSDGMIYAASDDGSLYVVNSNGKQVARFEGGDWLSHPVIADDGTIYLCDVDNKVWAISRDSCVGGQADLCWVADVNCDGVVDLDDVLLMALDWMEYGSSVLPRAGDADRDMYVDLGDFAAVACKWLDEI